MPSFSSPLHGVRSLLNLFVCAKMWLITRSATALPPGAPAIVQHTGPQQNPRAAYVASFSFSDDIAAYLRTLKELDFDIIFISTSPLSPTSLNSLKPLCRTILEKDNIGLDFASWQAGLAATGWGQGYSEVLITNDSVFGPVQPLAPIFDRMRANNLDVWGMIDSHQLKWHLQSWFVVFGPRALRSTVWLSFWQGIQSWNDKNRIIYDYELGLTRRFLPFCKTASSYSSRVLHNSSWQVLAHKPLPRRLLAMLTFRNPAVFISTLVRDHGFPFIKRDLFKPANRGAYGPLPWPLLPPKSTYPNALITGYLADIAHITNGTFTLPERHA